MTRSPITMGVDTPWPPSAAVQATFSFALHFSGRFKSAAMPFPSGPRHCGQSSVCTTEMAANTITNDINHFRHIEASRLIRRVTTRMTRTNGNERESRLRRGIRRLHHGVEIFRVTALLARPVAAFLTPAERHVVIKTGRRLIHHHETAG